MTPPHGTFRRTPKLYRELAEWWPLVSPPALYAEEAAAYRQLLLKAARVPGTTLLELGSGGGNNASHLKAHFALTLVDIAVEMLAVSRRLNPSCEHVHGDVRDVRLHRTFDLVLVHDSISYMTTEAELAAVIRTSYVHCKPGGAVLFVPNYIAETFAPSTDHGGTDTSKRGVRYLEWTWDPDPGDRTYVVDYAFLLRDADGGVEAETDHHIEGLFSRTEWLQALKAEGFAATVKPLQHSKIPTGTCEIFVAVR